MIDRHFNDAALDRFFWQQREEWHSTALAEALDEVSLNWHEQKLSLARAKLSEPCLPEASRAM